MNYGRMLDQLELHEGYRPTLYRDSVGKWTAGIGYNVDDRGLGPMSTALGKTISMAYLRDTGLTHEEARAVCLTDIRYFEDRVRRRFNEYDMLDEIRQRVCVDLAFNMGAKALGFKSVIAAVRLALLQTAGSDLRQACWDAACYHLMDSLWANQVDDGLGGKYGRADRLCQMLRTGADFAK